MRNRCGEPRSDAASGVSMVAVPEFVRANSDPPPNVVSMAHGAASNVSPKPACWNALPLKVATNSSECPAVALAIVPARAPSTTSAPPDTVAVPPGLHDVDDQSAGNAVPENSLPAAGLRITSPPAVSATYVWPSDVPAPKSAAVVSVAVNCVDGIVNDRVADAEALRAPSADATL